MHTTLANEQAGRQANMKLASPTTLLAIGLVNQIASQIGASRVGQQQQQQQQHTQGNSRLLNKCCQVGKERAIESPKFDCKLSSAREALVTSASDSATAALVQLLQRGDGPALSDQCEMVFESCCMGHHRQRNCDSGKQFAKAGSACMDVELSKETTIATESFNDCCMACSLGVLAARTPPTNDTQAAATITQSSHASRCKLMAPLASSLSGQLYEQTYLECCHENLPRVSGALLEPGEYGFAY